MKQELANLNMTYQSNTKRSARSFIKVILIFNRNKNASTKCMLILICEIILMLAVIAIMIGICFYLSRLFEIFLLLSRYFGLN